jgi:hypothetical protein
MKSFVDFSKAAKQPYESIKILQKVGKKNIGERLHYLD